MHELVLSLCKVSTAKEERKSPKGKLLFSADTGCIECVVEFAGSSIPLSNSKRTGKLLGALPNGEHALVVDQSLNITGIAISPFPQNQLLANVGFGKIEICFNGIEICELFQGECFAPRGSGSSRGLESRIEERLGSSNSSRQLLETIEQLQTKAVELHHGCTIVLDFKNEPDSLSGQVLAEPLDLTNENNLRIASSMSSVDGAIQIDRRCRLKAFACLLDGMKHDTENLSRGARYNSALRFASTRQDIIVFVVSEDGHRTVFDQDGEVTPDRSLTSFKYVVQSAQLNLEF